MKKLTLAFAATVATVLSMSGAAAAADKTKICFVYVGSKTDGGWTQAQDRGRQELQAHFGDKIETPYLENVPEGPDAERAIERLARDNCQMIYTTSFGFMDATIKVAKKFPKVKFEHATGFKAAENVATYNSRFYEGRYILGVIAGKMSKKGEAGYIASFPIPEVVMGINAFEQGAKSVNPNFKMKVIWVNTWADPGKEADAAKALLDQGVDILTQHTDTTAPMQIAEERGIKAFGQASDMIAAGPKSQLTAIVDTWGAYYIKRTQELLDGKWKSQQSFDGLKDGILTMAPYTNMPDDVKKLAEETEAKIRSGELHPFTGPINKQDGTPWLKAGEKAEDGALLGMNFYVEGVDDKLPK
ncbi:simple sugar transport system substrate-binding protein [Agrobacterium vitis]|nr:simple sugar transport system substrate-binding protein [Agrobacterium vitis]MBE1438750.1 simple sugar transport system substrate-binding protein [Agrobacterium vitis]